MQVNNDGTNIASFIKTLQRERSLLESPQYLLFVLDVKNPSRMEVTKMLNESTILKRWKVREIGMDSVASLINIFADEEDCDFTCGMMLEHGDII